MCGTLCPPTTWMDQSTLASIVVETVAEASCGKLSLETINSTISKVNGLHLGKFLWLKEQEAVASKGDTAKKNGDVALLKLKYKLEWKHFFPSSYSRHSHHEVVNLAASWWLSAPGCSFDSQQWYCYQWTKLLVECFKQVFNPQLSVFCCLYPNLASNSYFLKKSVDFKEWNNKYNVPAFFLNLSTGPSYSILYNVSHLHCGNFFRLY